MRINTSAVVAGILFSVCGQANANLMFVEPDSFAAGTVLTHAYAGVTLSVTGGYTGVVVAMDGYSSHNGRNIASTGSLVFGASPAHTTVPAGWETFNPSNSPGTVYRIFRADFSNPTDLVSIDLIADDDDIGELLAFNSSDELIGAVTTGLIVDSVFSATITRPTADIAYITAAGFQGESMFLDNLQYNYVAAVPEPDSYVLMLTGLGVIGWVVRRKKRQQAAV